MGVKLMTGATGEQNIQAADDRECLAGITGLDSYVFPTGSRLKATLVDANTVTIGTGAGSIQGSRFRCSTTTTVTIQSGTQGQYRRDIIGLRFSRETSGREGLEFQVLTGDPASSEGTVTDPEYTAGDLLKGDAEAFMPLYRVKLSGINAADPEPLFSVLTPLADLKDSVSQMPRIRKFFGSYVRSVPNWDIEDRRLLAISKEEYKALVGRDFNGYDVVQAFNGDVTANTFDVVNLSYWKSGNFWIDAEGGAAGSAARVNIQIVAFDFE